MPASPAPSPRTPSSPRSATSTRVSLGGFREVFEAVTAGEAAAGVVPIENVINGTVRENYDLLLEHDLEIRGEVVVPVRLCLAALPGPAPRRHRAGLLAHPGARPGRGVPAHPAVAAPDDLQHGRRRQGHRRRAASAARRPSCRRGPRRCSASRSWPTRSATCRATGPGSSSWPARDAARSPLAVAGDASPDDARRRGPQRAGHAARGPAGLRRPRPQHAQARVATRAASGPGNTSSGSTSTATRRSRDGGRARRAGRGHDDGAASWAAIRRRARRRRLTGPGQAGQSPGQADARSRDLVADTGTSFGARAGRRCLLDEHLADHVDDEHHDDEHDQRVEEQRPSRWRPPRPSRSCRAPS